MAKKKKTTKKKAVKKKASKKKATKKKAVKKKASKKKATKKKVVKRKATKKARTKSSTKKLQTKKSVNQSKSKPKKEIDWQSYLAPLYDRVLLEVFEAERLTPGGLILTNPDNSEYPKAKVLAVGKGILSKKGQIRPLDVKDGDHVLYQKFGGTEIQGEGKKLLIVREEDILGVIES